jgi:hypothetical protein
MLVHLQSFDSKKEKVIPFTPQMSNTHTYTQRYILSRGAITTLIAKFAVVG